MRRSQGSPILLESETRSTPLERVRLSERAGSDYDEAWLQRLIHEHPQCLPIHELEPGFGVPVSVCMELSTRHGSIDNLLMTPDGDLIIVEVKLWRNPEARRRVIGQALDYASCLVEMEYSELEQQVLKSDFGAGRMPQRLLNLFEGPDQRDEQDFVDAVNTNLSRGRILILIAGDGIRTEAQRLVGALQSHAGFHFSLALIELAVYRLPEDSKIVVLPRTLMRTVEIERGIVQIDDQRTRVAAREHTAAPSKPVRGSITADQFFDDMAELRSDIPDKLQAFLACVEGYGVYPDFRRTLIFRWNAPDGTEINLGYIMRSGQVWTNATNWTLPPEVSHPYEEELAAALGADVEKEALSGDWHIRIKGKAPNIVQLVDSLDKWADVLERFTHSLRSYYADISGPD